MPGAFGSSGGAQVQAGSVVIATNTQDVTLPFAVNPAKSFVIVDTRNAPDTTYLPTTALVNNGRTLRLVVQTTGATVSWQVVSM